MKTNNLQADLGMSATFYKVTVGVSCVWTLHNTPLPQHPQELMVTTETTTAPPVTADAQ